MCERHEKQFVFLLIFMSQLRMVGTVAMLLFLILIAFVLLDMINRIQGDNECEFDKLIEQQAYSII